MGSLEIDCGGMFAEKSTNLIRKGKRHIIAGKKVVFLKPANDDRYSEEAVVTHDGVEHKAIPVYVGTDLDIVERFYLYPEVLEADVVCIDEVQFFPPVALEYIDELIYSGKTVYCAGLDLDRFGKPFGIVPSLMARAEKVTKHHAVCGFCGSDAWVSLGKDSLGNAEQVNVGNEYTPACRSCADEKGGIW
jgi:thymidine kinase